MLFENAILDWHINNTFFAYQDPETKKYGIFNSYGNKMTNERFDSLEKIYLNHYAFLVSKDGKKDIYEQETGFKYKFEYDDIIIYDYFIVLVKDNEKYFVNKDNLSKVVGPFDDIYCKEKNKDELDIPIKSNEYICCKKDDQIHVYFCDEEEEIISYPCDNIELIYKHNPYNWRYGIDYFLKATIDGKNNLVVSTFRLDNKGEIINKVYELCSNKYDNISYYYYDKSFITELDGKKGIMQYFHDYIHKEINPKYNKISHGYGTFIDYKDTKEENCVDIIKFNKDTKNSIIESCTIINKGDSNCIYRKNNKYGILSDGHTYFDYDNAFFGEDKDFIYILKDNKYGLYYYSRIVLPCEYEDIKYKFSYNKRDYIMLALKQDGKYKLFNSPLYSYTDSFDKKLFLDKEFNDVIFTEKIMVCVDDEHIYLYSYNKELILETDKTNINIIKQDGNEYIAIGNELYGYFDEKFMKFSYDDLNQYLATYKINKDEFVVSSYDEDKYNAFCNNIDSKEDNDALKYFNDILNNESSEHLVNGVNVVRKKKIK